MFHTGVGERPARCDTNRGRPAAIGIFDGFGIVQAGQGEVARAARAGSMDIHDWIGHFPLQTKLANRLPRKPDAPPKPMTCQRARPSVMVATNMAKNAQNAPVVSAQTRKSLFILKPLPTAFRPRTFVRGILHNMARKFPAPTRDALRQCPSDAVTGFPRASPSRVFSPHFPQAISRQAAAPPSQTPWEVPGAPPCKSR